MTTPTQIRIDSDIKKQATELFATLGLDMSSAVNLFLHQCILRGGLPFNIELHKYNKETLKAMAEAISIANDSSIKGYNNMEDLKKALMEE
jgi:DNA-damage-inducible protein J